MKLESRRISQMGRVVTGKTPPTQRHEFFDGDYLFITPSDLNFAHYYCREAERTVTEDAKTALPNQFVPADAVMFTCIGATIGKCGLAPAECLTNQQINSIVTNEEHDARFIYYLLCNNVDYIRRLGGGAATPIISKSKFEEVELPVPLLDVQRRIADLLSAYDDLIENNRRRMTLLEEAARQRYREWFVRLRFPGHEHTRITNGAPEGWERRRVEELAELRGGKQLVGDRITDEGAFPVFGGNGVQGYTQEKTHDGFVIAFGRVGANCGSIHWSYDGAWINNNASGIVPNEHPELLLHHLLDVDFTNLRKGAAQPFIPNGVLATVEFWKPSSTLADLFCETARPLRLQQAALSKVNQKLRGARDLLLPRLMSGELAV